MQRLALILSTFATLAAACSSGSRPDLNADAAISNTCQVTMCTPDPLGVCQHTCTPDPGPRLVDCGVAEKSFDFGTTLWTFDPPDATALARGMYSYTDNSTIIQTFRTPPDRLTGRRSPKTWEPPTAILPRCSDRPNPTNHTIHIQGGPFLSWGGGVGIGMKNYPNVVGTVADIEEAMIDVSEWEGISFWARRGPDSQAGMRVLVGDKYTDDDISYIMYRNDPSQHRFCERVRECACLNHKTCIPTAVADVPPECVQEAHLMGKQTMDCCGGDCEAISGAASDQAGGSQCTTCVQTRCDERWPAYPDDSATPGGVPMAGIAPGSDRQFYGKPCSPHTMRNGIFSYWCFDPATERPAETTEQCGDHWTSVVNLSNEWQFYTVPFNSMRQQGWAKRSAKLDLTAVSVVRFTWDGGWIDYWIDDVKFYRTKKM